MEDYIIGTIIKYKDHNLKIIEDTQSNCTCKNCFFRYLDCFDIKCTKNKRKDNKDIIFIEI